MATAGDLTMRDPGALIRSRQYRVLLVIAAVIGLVVSFASWCFLQLVHAIQQGVYVKLPDALGLSTAPWWWPLPFLALAGVVTVFAVRRLPGHGGHVPYEGLAAGQTTPAQLPGILLAALATLGLGLVLGPEGPLIAGAAGLGVLAVRLARKDAPDQVRAVLAAAAAFAAISTIFGSPVVGTVILVEAAGLGGPTLPLVLLPGLMSAGIGSVVFLGLDGWVGLSSSNYAISPLSLPEVSTLTGSQFLWTAALAFAAAVATFVVVELARAADRIAGRRPWLLVPLLALVVGGLAIVFAQVTGESANLVLFSGQEALDPLVSQASTLSLGTLAALLVCKGLAWSLSLSSFRGGPTFPAILLGAAAGMMAGHLPGFSLTAGVAVLTAAMVVSILRLPLSAVVLTMVLTPGAGAAISPLVILSVVVAYITIRTLLATRSPLSEAPAAAA